MIEKVRATITKYGMLAAGTGVVAGVSGGADSVAMLHILLNLRDELNLKITAAHLNHKLRGDESERDENFVKDLCKRLNVEFTVEAADVAEISRSRGISVEEAGREARYAFFSRCQGEPLANGGKNADNSHVADGNVFANGNRIAVAHSLNDSVETALLNLARGTALRGISGIPPTRGSIIRPLIECTREEIENYCAENGLGFVTDSSNLTDDFARNKIRHHAIPALSSVNEGFWRHAANTLEALRLDADFLDNLAGAEIPVSRERYLSLERPVRYRILAKMLLKYQIPADSARFARLDAIVEAGDGAEQLSGDCFFMSDGHGFEVRRALTGVEYFCVDICVPEKGEVFETSVFPDKKLRLFHTDYEYCEENLNSVAKGLKNVLNYDKINGSLVVRQKLPADKVRLSGRNCTKTLRKLFQEKKLTVFQRERLFVLADNSGIIWVEGFGASEHVAASEHAERILVVETLEAALHEQNMEEFDL